MFSSSVLFFSTSHFISVFTSEHNLLIEYQIICGLCRFQYIYRCPSSVHYEEVVFLSLIIHFIPRRVRGYLSTAVFNWSSLASPPGSSRLYHLCVSQAQKAKVSGDERPRLRALWRVPPTFLSFLSYRESTRIPCFLA